MHHSNKKTHFLIFALFQVLNHRNDQTDFDGTFIGDDDYVFHPPPEDHRLL